MDPQVQANQQMVKEMMDKARAEQQAALLMQGNKAHIPVEVDYMADSGTEYKGTIIFRRPSSMDYIRIGATKAKLFAMFGVTPIVDPTSGMESMAHVDQPIRRLATALSMFQVLLVDPVPEWFKKYESLPDADLVFHIYDLFDEGLRSFRRPNESESGGNSETGSSEEAVGGSEAVRG